MVIVRAPFRIPLGGGGTDLPSYYKKYGGELVSVAIDKYAYVVMNRQILDKKIRVKYSHIEEVEGLTELKHDLVRESLRLTGIKERIEVYFLADLPAGTGMGASGSYLVALLKGFHTLNGEAVGAAELAEEACKIEIDVLKRPVGKQDQYMGAFGGVTHLMIDKTGKVMTDRMEIPPDRLSELENSLLLFYTGIQRDAGEILKHQNKSLGNKSNKVNEVAMNMHQIKEIGREVAKAIRTGDLEKFGTLMDFHWQAKRALSHAVSNPDIDRWYQRARLAGALGGKIMGAGGGGFLVFCCPGDKRKLRTAMEEEGLKEMFFRFDMEGAKVIADMK